MLYEIITLNEREKTRTVWGTFGYPLDSVNSSDRAYPLHAVYDDVVERLKEVDA